MMRWLIVWSMQLRLLLVAVAAILLAWAGHVVRRRYRRNAYRREGLTEIDAMKREGMQSPNFPDCFAFPQFRRASEMSSRGSGERNGSTG